jgi:hypothetical protein
MPDRNPERRVCPEEFQHAVNERFGFNRFGTPNFRLAWGETETIRVAGIRGYEDRLVAGNIPCWNIMRWRAPEVFGTPRLYELVNRDPATGLCLLGEYPYEGRYDVLQPLMTKEFKDGRLEVDAFPLSYYIIDAMLPMFIKGTELSEFEIAAANAYVAEQEKRAAVEEITDRLMDELPTRFGPVSYSKQGCRTAVITRKMNEISRVWDRMSKTALRNQRRGFYQGN